MKNIIKFHCTWAKYFEKNYKISPYQGKQISQKLQNFTIPGQTILQKIMKFHRTGAKSFPQIIIKFHSTGAKNFVKNYKISPYPGKKF